MIGSTNFTDIPWDDITHLGQATMLDSDLFNVSWILGRFCNYKCSYCWPYANSQTPDHQELETYINTINEIKTQANYNGFNKFHWSFSGGEPTAYKKILSVMNEVRFDSIHMTTNLSPGIQWWDRWLDTTKSSKRRSLTASYHHEFADETEFGDKIIHLMNNDVFVTVNQVMVPECFEELYNRCVRLSDRGINVTLKPQSNEQANQIVDGYTDDMLHMMRTEFAQHHASEELLNVKLIDKQQRVWFIDQAERFNSFNFNQFSGWSCNSGYQSVIIRGNEVKRSYSCKDEILGTLTGGFRLFDSPQVCITDRCVSSADSKIPKTKC